MSTFNPFIQLKKIEFQSDANEVMLTCAIGRENNSFSTHLVISHSELNRIIGNLQERNSDLDLYELMDRYEFAPDFVMYSLDFEKKNIANSWIPNFISAENHLQIRA